MPSVDLGTKRIEYEVVKGNSRRYTYFRFRPDLTLEVILPRGGHVDVEKSIKDRAPWLERELERISKTRNVLSQEAVMFDGKYYKVVFAKSPEDKLVPNPTKGEVTVFATDTARLGELVRRWFLRESSAYVVKKVAQMARQLGVKPKRVDVREVNKWGYCTRSGRLSFSWQLIALPEKLREYVVTHELVHLIEFNHSPAFKARLARILPDFREREKELNHIVLYDLAMHLD